MRKNRNIRIYPLFPFLMDILNSNFNLINRPMFSADIITATWQSRLTMWPVPSSVTGNIDGALEAGEISDTVHFVRWENCAVTDHSGHFYAIPLATKVPWTVTAISPPITKVTVGSHRFEACPSIPWI